MVEGQNTERGQAIISINETVGELGVRGQHFGTDFHWGDDAQAVSAAAEAGIIKANDRRIRQIGMP